MENSTASKIIIGSFLGLLALCLVWAITAQQSKISLTKRLGEQELKSEALLSEKLLVQKALDGSKDSNNMLITRSTELDELLKHRTKLLSTQTRENIKIEKALEFAEHQRETESQLSNDLRKELDSRTVALDSLSKALTDSINFLKDHNAYLESELKGAIMSSIDQTLVSGLKRNNSKVTSKARATKKLIANVEVPGKLQDLTFTLEGPTGEVVSGSNGSISARVLEDNQNAVASANNEIYPYVKSQNIELSYVPDERLKPGTYTFKIFNGEEYVGSMMVNLR